VSRGAPSTTRRSARKRVAWDGSFSDLLQADALSMCWIAAIDDGGSWQGNAFNEDDPLLLPIISKMQSAKPSAHAQCSSPTSNVEDNTICGYLESRKDPAYNIDVSSASPRALDTSHMRTSSQTASTYQLPRVSTLGLTGS
jgi:hypothetical protein